MRLAPIAKYSLVRKPGKVIICIVFFYFSFYHTSNAQKLRLTFTNTPLSEALLEVSKQLDVKVAFDAQKLDAVIVNKEVSGNTAEEFFTNLLANSGLQFVYKHNTFLIIDKPVNEPVPDPVQCQVVGSILDKESGEQLPFASVSLVNQNYNTYASENGSFSIKSIAANPMHLVVSYIGYRPVDTLINWATPSMNCDFRLSRKYVKIDSVIVKANKLEMIDYRNDVDFVTTINPTKLIDLPVLAETDVFKTMQLLPGIKYSENSAELSIRGGSGDQNLVLYDGQTLYNLSHYFGVFSSLNPNIIKDIQIYKGGYDSRFGERVSGIVDITGKSGNQTKPTIYGDINLINANLATEIPLSKKLTLIAAGRRSYSDVYSTSFAEGLFEKSSNTYTSSSNNIVEQTKPSFYFYDYDTKLTYRLSNNENLSLSFYGGKDFFDNTYGGTDHTVRLTTHDYNTWNNYGISALWLKQWNSSFFSNLQMGTSGYTNEYANTTIADQGMMPDSSRQRLLPGAQNQLESANRNKLNDYSIAVRNIYYLSNQNQINFGVSARRNSVVYHHDAGQSYVYNNISQADWLTSIYGQDRIILAKRLTIKPGFRASIYGGNNQFYVEPRLALSYKFSDKFSVRAATGKYYQFISQVLAPQETGYNKNFWVMADDSIHPVLASNHYVVGTTFEFRNFLFDVETYYKTYNGLQEYIYIPSDLQKSPDFPNYFKSQSAPVNPAKVRPLAFETPLKASYFIDGSGKSYGIDFFVRYKIQNFTSWISYSLGRSLQRFAAINNGSEIPAPNDQTHQVSWTNMLTVRHWNFGTTTLFASGRPYIDFTEGDQNLPTTRNYKRLPNYFRSDFSVNYNFTLGRARMKVGATIINLFNTQNYYDINTRKFDFQNTSFSETNLIQSQALSLNLFLHFVL